MAVVINSVGRRFGAILWDVSANIDDAIQFVKACPDPASAIELMVLICQDGQRWAVVDLQTMHVVAGGSTPLEPAEIRPVWAPASLSDNHSGASSTEPDRR